MRFPKNITVYGDKSYRNKKCPKEGAEQITFFNELRKLHPEVAAIACHIKNEGRRTHGQIMHDKANGMVTGAPDIIIPGCPTLLIELKRADHTESTLGKAQVNYLNCAQDHGATVCIALGYKAALEAVEVWKDARN